MSAEKPAPDLADLRQEIDRIDEGMHRLLMERGTIIDRLIASKKASKAGLSSAFRQSFPALAGDASRKHTSA